MRACIGKITFKVCIRKNCHFLRRSGFRTLVPEREKDSLDQLGLGPVSAWGLTTCAAPSAELSSK